MSSKPTSFTHVPSSVSTTMSLTQNGSRFEVLDSDDDDPIIFNNESLISMITSMEENMKQFNKRLSKISSKLNLNSNPPPTQISQQSRDCMDRLIVQIGNLCNRVDAIEKKKNSFCM